MSQHWNRELAFPEKEMRGDKKKPNRNQVGRNAAPTTKGEKAHRKLRGKEEEKGEYVPRTSQITTDLRKAEPARRLKKRKKRERGNESPPQSKKQRNILCRGQVEKKEPEIKSREANWTLNKRSVVLKNKHSNQ